MSTFHEKLQDPALKESFKSGAYTDVLLLAIKMYEEAVQEKAASEKKLSGNTLMVKAFAKNDGLLRLKEETDAKTSASKISSIGFLSRGLFKAIEMPTDNAKNLKISKEKCLEMLAITSYLFRELDEMEKAK